MLLIEFHDQGNVMAASQEGKQSPTLAGWREQINNQTSLDTWGDYKTVETRDSSSRIICIQQTLHKNEEFATWSLMLRGRGVQFSFLLRNRQHYFLADKYNFLRLYSWVDSISNLPLFSRRWILQSGKRGGAGAGQQQPQPGVGAGHAVHRPGVRRHCRPAPAEVRPGLWY